MQLTKKMWLLTLVVIYTLCEFSQKLPLSTCASFNNAISPQVVIDSILREKHLNLPNDTRIRGMRDTRGADFVLAGIFPIHSDFNGKRCGNLRHPGGLDRVEAMLFALDLINLDSTILPNITIGYDIRDSCFVEQIGLDEAADLILTGIHMDNVETLHSKQEVSSQNAMLNQSSDLSIPFTIGLVGAASSQVSIPIAGLCRLFSVPQISYSSTSTVLSNRERYTYFHRTVPSDDMEANAMIDLMKKYKWNLISVIFSKNSYGNTGISTLRQLATKENICLDLYEGIAQDFNTADYQMLIQKLSQSTANVVVLYATEQHVRSLFDELAKLNPSRHFTWIASSAWTQITPMLPPELVVGLFGFFPHFDHVSQFQDYYTTLTLDNNNRNPWFPEFYSTVFNCTKMEECDNQSIALALSQMEQEHSIPTVIDATYAFAHALHNYLTDNCDSPLVWNKESQTCKGQKNELKGQRFLNYVANVNFTSLTGNTVTFNQEGSVDTCYEIANFQMNETSINKTTYTLKTIGKWESALNSANLNIHKGVEIHFGMKENGNAIKEVVYSHCGACLPGQYLRKVKLSCCGLCESCVGQLFSNNSEASACSNCSMFGDQWGNNSTVGSTSCIKIPEMSSKFTDPFSIVIMIVSLIGIILVIFTIVCLGRFWNTPVVKASSRESVTLILIGVGLSYLASFCYLAPPSLTICSLQRMLIWICSSLMFGSLLIKVVRIARLFVLNSSNLSKLKCMKSYHQVVFSLLLVAGQVVIVLISLLVVNPRVQKTLVMNTNDPNSLPTVVVTCQPEPLHSLVVSVIYEAALILAAVVLSTLSFKIPSNFNEAKAVCSAGYILLAIWSMFFVSYFFTQQLQQLQNSFIALTMTIGAYAVLVCFFGPKVLVILFWKERNKNEFSRRTVDIDIVHTESDFQGTHEGIRAL